MDLAILIVLIIMLFIVCAAIFAGAYALVFFTKYLKEKEERDSHNDFKEVNVEKIDKMFADVVEREFNEYQKFHPDISQEGSYIKRDEIQAMVTAITSRVFVNMTPALRFNIGLIYDISEDEKLINLIGEKVGFLVMGLAAMVNSSMIDDTKVNLNME